MPEALETLRGASHDNVIAIINNTMARVLSSEEIQVFKELFDSYDTDKGGNISVEEFAKVMSQSPGKPPTEAEVAQIVKEVDLDGDGTINFNEFITMMTGQPYPAPSSESGSDASDYSEAWKQFEPSMQGSITPSQFRQLMAQLGEPVSDTEVEGLINSVDGEGKLSYKQFEHFMKNRNLENDILNDYE
ncbi:calmodulin [Camillea tinctor]|nr:calmodulin [Camillea tinctor]